MTFAAFLLLALVAHAPGQATALPTGAAKGSLVVDGNAYDGTYVVEARVNMQGSGSSAID